MVNFSPRRTIGVANSYVAFSLMFTFISVGTIFYRYYTGSVVNRDISLGYIVGFLINCMLGMITLYALGHIKIVIALFFFFLIIVLFVLFQLNQISEKIDDSGKNIMKTATSFMNNSTNSNGYYSAILNYLKLNTATSWGDFSTYFVKWTKLDDSIRMDNTSINSIYNVFASFINLFIGFPVKLALILVSLVGWVFQAGIYGLYTGLWYAFSSFVANMFSNANISTPSNSFFENISENVRKSLTYSLYLCMFMFFVLIMYSSQDTMRSHPINMLIVAFVFLSVWLGYIFRFKNNEFDDSFNLSMVGLLFFAIYLYNPKNIIDKISGVNMFAIFVLFFYLVGIIFIYNYFPAKPLTANTQKSSASQVANLFENYFGKIVMVLISAAISISVIMFLVASISNMNDDKPSAGVVILNILIVVGMLTLLFNTLDSNRFVRDHPLFKLIVSIILYIPCLLTDLSDWLLSEYYKTKYFTFIIILFEIVFIILYWVLYPELITKMYTGGGNVLVNGPVPLNKERTIGYYGKLILNKNPHLPGLNLAAQNNSYVYAISFWVYLNPMPSQGDNYYSILNYGNNPNVMYNTKTNEFVVFMQQKSCSLTITDPNSQLEPTYTDTNFPLQKWMNVVLNYNGGRLDIFLNSKLVKTSYDVENCIQYDNLTIGQSNGLNAKICNVIYFNNPIDIMTVHNLYNLTKITDVPEIPKQDLFDF